MIKRRGEMVLIERAINGGWDVPEAARRKAVELVAEVMADPRATKRELLRASRLALRMEQDNMRFEEQQKAEQGNGTNA